MLGSGRTTTFSVNGRLGSLPDSQRTAEILDVSEMPGRTESKLADDKFLSGILGYMLDPGPHIADPDPIAGDAQVAFCN